jgi:RHS repeat-associated protein
LTYLFFDDQFNFVASTSGAERVQAPGDGQQPLMKDDIRAVKNGYVFVYLSNESAEPVFFDNFTVSQVKSPLIEDAHYYAYGLKIAAISSKAVASTLNPQAFGFGYQSAFAEEISAFELNYNEFELRTYDPQISRWTSVDPFNEYASPYASMGFDPVKNVDPNGGNIFDAIWKFFGGTTQTLGADIIDDCLGQTTRSSGLITSAASSIQTTARYLITGLAYGMSSVSWPGFGRWPGVTTMFREIDATIGGAGLGATYVNQRGLIYDEVGTTHFKMTTKVVVTPNDKTLNTIAGANISLTVGMTQSWRSETFLGNIGGGSQEFPIPDDLNIRIKGFNVGAFIAAGIGIGPNNITLKIGLGVGSSLSSVEITNWQSISLTDSEKYKVKEKVGANSWLQMETWEPNMSKIEVENGERGQIGYSTYLLVRFNGKVYNTGITIRCGVKYDQTGNPMPNGLWLSNDYLNAAIDAERD